jgi:hypothetical protein
LSNGCKEIVKDLAPDGAARPAMVMAGLDEWLCRVGRNAAEERLRKAKRLGDTPA